MRTRRVRLLFLGFAGTATLAGGCVDRRYVVETNVPGAQITVDGKPIGPSPADGSYVYAGGREIQAVAPGYQPLTQKVRFKPKWYDYPPLDFFAEVVWPFRIQDVRRVKLELEPARPVRTDELLGRADELRAKGQGLPPPSVPDDQGGSGNPAPRPRAVEQAFPFPSEPVPNVISPLPPGRATTTNGSSPLPNPPLGTDPSSVFPPPAAPSNVPNLGTFNDR